MRKNKTIKIILDTYGNYLGMEKGCIVLRDKNGDETRYPLVEDTIGEIVLNSGNMISTGFLTAMASWGIDVLISTRYGRPVAMLKDLDDDFHVETRVGQYEALHNGKGCILAKRFVAGKLEGQNNLLEKYGLETSDSILNKVRELDETDLKKLRRRLLGLEGKFGRFYFKQVFRLFPSRIRPHYRKSYQAYDGANNMFNLAYRILFWKCYKSLANAHLEPYLGFLHDMQFGRASLVCDFMELYRHLVDGFLIEFSQGLRPGDFVAKAGIKNKRLAKRMYLNDALTKEMVSKLFDYFQSRVPIPRDRIGKRQKIETLINEEAFLLGRYFRVEKADWIPRIAVP